MKYLLHITYSLFYTKIPTYILQKWILSQRIKWLVVVARKGHYKNRIQIAELIPSLHINGQHKLINILLDDPVISISQKVIKISESLKLLDELKKRIIEKQIYWHALEKELEDNRKAYAKIYKDMPHYKRKFSNGESYQQMKQALKKSMNIGKWM